MEYFLVVTHLWTMSQLEVTDTPTDDISGQQEVSQQQENVTSPKHQRYFYKYQPDYKLLCHMFGQLEAVITKF